jgi:endoglucanase
MHIPKRLFVSIIVSALTFFPSTQLQASKLAELTVIDKDYLMVHFKDGEVTFRDDGKGPGAFMAREHQDDIDTVKKYGAALSTTNAVAVANWALKSEQDANYGTAGKNPVHCYRKSKLNGMAEREWQSSDYRYEYTMEHFIFLQLPSSLLQGDAYTLDINATINSDQASSGITFDIFNCRSEALHINLVGYAASSPSKAADLYCWMGDGGARDYKSFEGKDVFVYNVDTKKEQKAGAVTFWKASGAEAQGYNLIKSSVWNADFPAFTQAGTYRIAIDGVGCSQDFLLADDVFYDPFKVSVLGFFYMRIGQDSAGGIRPVPRRPLWLPGKDPADMKVYITTMQAFHSEWKSFTGGDPWDNPNAWSNYKKSGNPVNPNVWGGHSDALDWDRHLGHISIIYDMLLPFVLTKGAISDDNLGIAESGNGIPDILDEARYEVDFWLRLRDGQGYSHGLTNPNDNHVFYQAGTTAFSAWANALNCAMLAECFRIAKKTDLTNAYRDSAVAAYTYAGAQTDRMLDTTFDIGECAVRGKDLKMMAASFLYNVTGETKYEDAMKSESDATTKTSNLADVNKLNQLWGSAGYLLTTQTVHYPDLAANMKASIIAEAKNEEANYSASRPSRRSTDNLTGYFQTEQNVHRTLIAHAIDDNETEKATFYKALVLEADWSLGRNPLNSIQMTTASTGLASKRSVENIYTSGYDDGTPGMHPGHTPYMNVDDWDNSMVMGRPSWLYEKGYPTSFDSWPKAEAYFNTRYVWAHSEFTPQQTMRGKTALYGYLYGIGKPHSGAVRRTVGNKPGDGSRTIKLTVGAASLPVPEGKDCAIRLLDLSGRTLWSGKRTLTKSITLPATAARKDGVLILDIRYEKGTCVRMASINLK